MLTFEELRTANLNRVREYRHGEIDAWSPEMWFTAMMGEAGEFANFYKKYIRGDYSFEEVLPNLQKELADIQIYLDLLAARLNINLAEATRNKWNESSQRIGSNLKL